MKLYLLSQSENDGYDTFDSCVVCAESEEDAKTITPDGHPMIPNAYATWASDVSNVQCQEIGEANAFQQRGVIIASFNAG